MNVTKSILFWQPRIDYLPWFESNSFRKKILVVLNYIIWLFFFYISFILIKSDINIFGQILMATIIAEIIERYLKSKINWRRPLFNRNNQTPFGLVDRWYKTGSFPSGHTIKAVYFLLFIIQYQIFSPVIFLLIVIPLLTFRVVIGFHYPIDILGGLIVGVFIWFLVREITFPLFFNQLVQSVFDFIFYLSL